MTEDQLQQQLDRGLELYRKKKFRSAQSAFTSLAESSDPSISAQANFELARIFDQSTLFFKGDSDAVIKYLRAAMEKGDPEWSSAAAFRLGQVLGWKGQTDEAVLPFRQAVESGHHEWCPKAAVELGVILEQQQKADEANALFRQALDSDQPHEASRAGYELGKFYVSQGDIDEARKMYTRSLQSGGLGTWGKLSGKALEALPGGKDDAGAAAASALLDEQILAKARQLPSGTTGSEDLQWLSAGERILINTDLVIANSKKQSIPIVATDQRIVIAGMVFDFQKLLPVHYESKPRSETRSPGIKTTHYASQTFTFKDGDGRQTVVQLSENLARNFILADVLRELIDRFVDPARALAVLNLIRNGTTKWTISQPNSNGEKAPVVVLQRAEFTLTTSDGPHTFKWSERPMPEFTYPARTLRARDVDGQVFETPRILLDDRSLIQNLLQICQAEFVSSSVTE
jgi:tetratricopeptide (TPR) repeat protein